MSELSRKLSQGLLVSALLPLFLLVNASDQVIFDSSINMVTSVSRYTATSTDHLDGLILGKIGGGQGCYAAWTSLNVAEHPVYVKYRSADPLMLYILSRNEKLEWLYAPTAASCEPQSFSFKIGPLSAGAFSLNSLTVRSNPYTILFVGNKSMKIVVAKGSIVTGASTVIQPTSQLSDTQPSQSLYGWVAVTLAIGSSMIVVCRRLVNGRRTGEVQV